MNIALKIGVNSQARKLIGSAPGWAGSSGGCGVADGCTDPEAAGDPPGTHPAPSQETVLLDGLLRVAGAGRFITTARRHPGEHDPVEPDHPDPDALHRVDPPRAPP